MNIPLSIQEFSTRANMSVPTVRRRLKKGLLPAVQTGGPGTEWQIDYEAYRAMFTIGKSMASSASETNPASASDAPSKGKRKPKWFTRVG